MTRGGSGTVQAHTSTGEFLCRTSPEIVGESNVPSLGIARVTKSVRFTTSHACPLLSAWLRNVTERPLRGL